MSGGAMIILGLFLGVVVIAELWARWGRPKPEWTRKFVHINGGLVCLLFPFLVESAAVVFFMAISVSILFAVGGSTGLLKCLHGVERRSRGAEFYPLSIAIAFLLTSDQTWIYLSSVLILAVADAGAALIGMRYGRARYTVEDESKSLEGSLAFMAISFLAIYIPATLMTDLSQPACVWSALLVAALLTGFEAISLNGTDNLFVPLGVCVILKKISVQPVPEMVYQNVSLWAILAGGMLLTRRTRSFNAGGLLVFTLFFYGAWSLGSEWWALPLLFGFLVYSVLIARLPDTRRFVQIRVLEMFRPLSFPLVLLVIANIYWLQNLLYGPYIAAMAMIVALFMRNQLKRGSPLRDIAAVLSVSFIPWWVQGIPIGPWLGVLVVCIPLLFAESRWAGPRGRWTALQYLLTVAAALSILALQALEWIPEWDAVKMIRLIRPD